MIQILIIFGRMEEVMESKLNELGSWLWDQEIYISLRISLGMENVWLIWRDFLSCCCRCPLKKRKKLNSNPNPSFVFTFCEKYKIKKNKTFIRRLKLNLNIIPRVELLVSLDFFSLHPPFVRSPRNTMPNGWSSPTQRESRN